VQARRDDRGPTRYFGYRRRTKQKPAALPDFYTRGRAKFWTYFGQRSISKGNYGCGVVTDKAIGAMPVSPYPDDEQIAPVQWRAELHAARAHPRAWRAPSATARAKAAMLAPGFRGPWTRLAAMSGALILAPLFLWWGLIRLIIALTAHFR
jgi:hypothetical protein